MYQVIILPLEPNTLSFIEKLGYDGNEVLLDIDSVMSFIFYAFSLHSDFSNALQYSIDTFRSDFLLNRPEITPQDVSYSLENFKALFLQLYLNLSHYNITINEQLPYDFYSFLTEKEIILKKSTNSTSRIQHQF